MSGKRVFGRRAATGLIAAAGLSVLAAAGASAASAVPRSAAAAATPAPSWKIAKSVNSGDFTTVVASSSTTGWAFDEEDTPAPVAYRHAGGNWSSWTKFSGFPGVKGEAIVAAAATSADDVWAVSQVGVGSTGGRVFSWNGHKWTVVKTFKNPVGGLAVLGPRDVWVFGNQEDFPAAKDNGAWHYNGATWSQVSSGRGLAGGSAVSHTDVWAFHGTSVYQWTGSAWHGTSVASLLPKKMQLNNPQVTGILAEGKDNVYAIGNGTDEDDGGPTVVLHYNGSKWAKEASGNYGYGSIVSLPEQSLSSDGGSGLWLPQPGADGAPSYIVHYAGSALKAAPLPVSGHAIAVFSVARIPGTAWQVATGYTFNTHMFAQTAVILVYSR